MQSFKNNSGRQRFPWESKNISALNASNNLNLKSDKVACLHLGILSATATRTYVRSSFEYGPRTHNKTSRLTLLRATSLKLAQTIFHLAFRRVTVAA